MSSNKINHYEANSKNISEIVFTSYSKKLFYLRAQISAFVLLNDRTPFNPYMNFEYNLSGIVDKRHIRIANNTMINRSNELWVFGDISDGVLMEIYLARKFKKAVRFFRESGVIEEFEETPIEKVQLEDVSKWMWQYILEGKNLERWHPRLRFKTTYPLVYPAYSKRNFFWQMHISKFCIEKKSVPLNPFMLFRYFLADIVPRDTIYEGNNTFIANCDELWTFGEISNGVLAEVKFAKEKGIPVKHYRILDPKPEYVKFHKISKQGLVLEKECENLDLSPLR